MALDGIRMAGEDEEWLRKTVASRPLLARPTAAPYAGAHHRPAVPDAAAGEERQQDVAAPLEGTPPGEAGEAVPEEGAFQRARAAHAVAAEAAACVEKKADTGGVATVLAALEAEILQKEAAEAAAAEDAACIENAAAEEAAAAVEAASVEAAAAEDAAAADNAVSTGAAAAEEAALVGEAAAEEAVEAAEEWATKEAADDESAAEQELEAEEAAAGLAALLSAAPGAEPPPKQAHFASVVEALALPVPADRRIRGARPPQEHRQSQWAIQFKICSEQGWVGGLHREAAAVATDLVLARRRCLSESSLVQPANWNVPGARYEQDEELVRRLRQIQSASAMQDFLRAILKPGTTAPPSRRQRQAGHGRQGGQGQQQAQQQQGQQQAQQQQHGSPGYGHPAAAPPAAAPADDPRSWELGGDGWWRRRLSASTCKPWNNQYRLGLQAVMFQSLAGRPPEAPRDVLEVVSAEDGRRYQLAYRHSNQTFSSYLQGSQLGAWVQASGARVGDSMGLKREGQEVLVRRFPAAAATASQGPGQQEEQQVGEPVKPDAAETSSAGAAAAAPPAGVSPPRSGSRKRKQPQWGSDWVVSQQRRGGPAAPSGAGAGGRGADGGSARHAEVKEEQEQEQEHAAAQPAPPAQLLPTAASGGGSSSLQGAGGSGGLFRAPSTVSERAAQAAERKVQQALAAFAAADTESGDSMLRPLRLLVLAGKGGRTLRTVVHGWPSFSAAAQQELFDAALIIASEGGWEQLEEQLALALEAAA